jgi:SAM-dependent methyltransferase
MNRTKLKNYAPQARRAFIQAMTDRAAFYGLTAKNLEPVVERGDVAVIAGREHPRSVAKKRKQLEDRIERHGFERTMEALAYTWFNRLVAIRFMELHGYLDHGYRVLSHPEGKPTPEILEHAEHVDLPGIKKVAVIDLKLAGNKESELYRLLLIAQCNALHAAMPFLFEKIDDETELLLPANLLHSDSLIRKLVGEIDEDDWQQVEIIGWLYQFYISERKDEVIGKVVASEDIPAATQLFTPNWIVKYLVQNTLGRQWLATYPQSALRQQMEFYIEPAEQSPDVQEQLKAITPTSLNPEELTLLDPACGSGHILVEAYDLFKAIYQERGYRAKDIPTLILQRNIFGLEIDDRAAQLAAFALMMKARADDRRIFDGEAKPNIMAIRDSQGMNAADLTHSLNSPINMEDVPKEFLFEEIQEEKDGLFSKKALAEKGHVSQADIAHVLKLFENGKTFGSLIQIPPKLAAHLPEIEKRLDEVRKFGDLTHASAHVLKPLLQQARQLSRLYRAVVTNPPYLGTKGMNPLLKEFGGSSFSRAKADLYAAFTERCAGFADDRAFIGLMTPFTWMFISSFAEFREWMLHEKVISSLIQPEYHAFFESAYVPICAFVILNRHLRLRGDFIKLTDFYGESLQPQKTLEAIQQKECGWRYTSTTEDFDKIPGRPIAYWVSAIERDMYVSGDNIAQHCSPRKGMDTGENAAFLRLWHEVSISSTSISASDEAAKWFPYNKGGDFRKWYGNRHYLVNWEINGAAIKARLRWTKKKPTLRNQRHYFQEGYTWTTVSSSGFSARYTPPGALFDNGGCTLFAERNLHYWGGLVNSKVSSRYLEFLSPTLNFQPGDIGRILYRPPTDEATVIANTQALVRLAKLDWDSLEESWEFQKSPLLEADGATGIESAFQVWCITCSTRFSEMKRLEEENNRVFIATYGLESQMSNVVTDDQITLYRPGLIYAHNGNKGFAPGSYKTFRADDDGIIPLLETDWGIRDDATNRLVEFFGVAWSKEHLNENLKFVADSLSPNNDELPGQTIRRYLATLFYKDHLSQKFYANRPIYWLFSSGKQRAFQCLVYLHRYHEGTLARMRNEYVLPLQGQIAARIEQLEGDKAKAGSTSHRRKLQKEQDDLKKKQTELATFEEKLKHAADKKIKLDLDDGVKVNYAKFGDLVAESKAITGGKEEE